MTKEMLCDSCFYGNVEIREIYVPLFPSSRDVKKVKRLVVFCNLKFGYVQKFTTYNNHTCNYRPKAGKVGKNIVQKTL
jgi:hypothetical protein